MEKLKIALAGFIAIYMMIAVAGGDSRAAGIRVVPSTTATVPGSDFSVDIVAEGIPPEGLAGVQFRLNVNAQGGTVTGMPDVSQAGPADIAIASPLLLSPYTTTRSGIGDSFWSGRSANGILFMDNEQVTNGSALYTFSHTNGATRLSGNGSLARFVVRTGTASTAARINIALTDVLLLTDDRAYPLDYNTGASVQLRCLAGVPALQGLDLDTAKSALTAANLSLGYVYEISNPNGTHPLNVVLEQSSPAGTEVDCNSSINLAIDTAPVDGTIVAVPGNSLSTVSWSGFSDTGTGIGSYILVSDSNGVPGSCTAGTEIYRGTNTTYEHTSLTNGSTYYYRVCAVDSAGNMSFGVTAWAIPQSPEPPPDNAPTTPTLHSPAYGEEVAATTPTLAVNASTDPDGDPVRYVFEVSPRSDFSSIIASANNIAGSDATILWTVPSNLLPDNSVYYWRALATDGKLNSRYMAAASFFVNMVNDPPMAPSISAPSDNGQVASLRPTLSVGNATDPENDVLTYEFSIAADSGFNSIVTGTTGVSQGSGTTSWTPGVNLSTGTPYFWRCRARDAHGVYSAWTVASFLVNTANQAPSAPGLNTPADGGEIATATPTLIANNSSDPDGNPLSYVFEIDTLNSFAGSGKLASPPVTEGYGVTSWTAPLQLTEDTRYFWRVKANDGTADGPWMPVASFFVNAVNDPPSTPTLRNPPDNGEVWVLTPTLSVNPAKDPEGNALTYEFEVYGDNSLANKVVGISGQGTSWIVPQLQDSTRYYWRARAVDEHDAAGGWMTLNSFFVNQNGSNDSPVISAFTATPASGALPLPVVFKVSATDPDGQVVKVEWDFNGDGIYDQTTTEPTVSHTYTTEGTFTAACRVTDNLGATAQATTTVTAILGKSMIGGFITGKGISSPGVLYLDIKMTNSGTGNAYNITLNNVVLRTLAGSGTVTYNASLSPPLPYNIGNLEIGASTTFRLYLNVPASVTRFSITEYCAGQNAIGQNISISAGQAVFP